MVIVGGLVLVVRSLLTFSRQTAEFSPQLTQLETEADRLRSGLSETKENVEKLVVAVEPVRERETRLREYCDRLRDIELEHERAVAKQEADAEAESSKRIKRRKIGYD